MPMPTKKINNLKHIFIRKKSSLLEIKEENDNYIIID
jgi:hypothetical protein